jgi:Protein of unknown function (DUF3352)
MGDNPAMPETAAPAPERARGGILPADIHQRRRVVAAAAAVGLVVLVVVLVLVLSGSGDTPPANKAAKLVPPGTLVYLNASTDPSRDGVKRALHLAGRFPGFGQVRDALERRLGTRAGPIDFNRQVRPWLGNEAALAILPATAGASQSEIVLDVRDRGKAEKFLTQTAGAASTTKYRGVEIRRYGTVATAFVSGELVIAPETIVRGAIDRSQGRAKSLDKNGLFTRAYKGLPDGRALDVFVSRDGVRRLLAPQGGVLGLAATLVDQPALAAVGGAITASGSNAKISVNTVLDPALAKATPTGFKPFKPQLLDSVPKGVVAYLGVAGLDRAAGRLLGLAGATGVNGAGIQQLAQRARVSLAHTAGVDIDRDVIALLREETALFILPGLPTPTLALVAQTPDEKRTREVLAKLQLPLAKLFAPPAVGAGQAPTFQDRSVAGVDAFQLRLAPTIEIDYAVFDGKLVIATSLEGIRRVKQHEGALKDDPAFQSVLSDRPSTVTSLVFLDFGQLLALSERTGLGQDPAYLAVRDDLQRVRAVGVATSAKKNETTAEITISVK